MLGDMRVTTDELVSAATTFTLLAWAFAYAFSACQAWVPGSFSEVSVPPQPRTWMELLFLSFSTLSGVGLDRKSNTSELQSLMRISYAVFCLKKKNKDNKKTNCT